MTVKAARYLPTEPPATLIEPLTLKVEGALLTVMNQYRQARHAYFSAYRDEAPADERERLLREFNHQAELLAMNLESEVSVNLGEPDDWS